VVYKINKVEHVIPLSVVTVHLTDQLTGKESTRNVHWDSFHTTEEPLEVAIGESGKITVELAQARDYENRPRFRWHLTDEGIDYAGTHIHLGAYHFPNNVKAAKILLSDLRESGEAWAECHALEADSFPEDVNVWAANHAAEIDRVQLGLAEGLER
jgi:hypothetical protein